MALVGLIAFLGACALTDAQRPWCDLIVAAIPDFTVEVPRLGAAIDRTAVPPHARRAKVVGLTASRDDHYVMATCQLSFSVCARTECVASWREDADHLAEQRPSRH
jgi:hypothetical protein